MSVTITYVNQMMTTKVSVVFFKGKGLLGDRKKENEKYPHHHYCYCCCC